jgi:hypothetical protein
MWLAWLHILDMQFHFLNKFLIMSNQTSVNPLPASFVSHEEVNLRVNSFINSKHNMLTATLNKQETRAIWYAFEHLEQLMDELKYKEASGMRIYFGAYPGTHQQYAGQLCLIMIPTRINTTTMVHEDIIIENEPDFTERIAGFDPNEIVEMYKNFNFGSPCPPACISGDLTYPLAT